MALPGLGPLQETLEETNRLLAAVLAQAAVVLEGEVAELGDEHLPHLAGGAGHERDAASLRDVARHGGAVVDRLVVGVGVDEEQPQAGSGGHP